MEIKGVIICSTLLWQRILPVDPFAIAISSEASPSDRLTPSAPHGETQDDILVLGIYQTLQLPNAFQMLSSYCMRQGCVLHAFASKIRTATCGKAKLPKAFKMPMAYRLRQTMPLQFTARHKGTG